MSEVKPAQAEFRGGSEDEALVGSAIRHMTDQVREADFHGHEYYPKNIVDDLLLAIGVMFEPFEDPNARVNHPEQALPVVERFIKEHGLPKEAASGLETLKAELEGQQADSMRAAETTEAVLQRVQGYRELLGKAATALSRVPDQEGLIKLLKEANLPESSTES